MSLEAWETADRAIAVIGLGAVLPDAANAKQFWDNVLAARYSITEVPKDRWDPADYYDPDPKAPFKSYSKIGGWVRDFSFDSLRFRIPPKVAAAMDQSQMWGISATQEALLDAGHPDRPLNLDRTAAVVGNAMGGELHYKTALSVMALPTLQHALEQSAAYGSLSPAAKQAMLREVSESLQKTLPGITEDSMPGELANVVAGRIAHVFDLHGPNYICDAACASSLAALDAAIEGLVSRHFDVAVCGGVDRNMGPSTFVKFCKIGALSADGSRPFAKGANGFVMGEGAALFVLKRLADAERDGDKVYAVIRSLGASSDGRGKGITAPNPDGQKRSIVRAYERAGLSPQHTTLIEAHGTSTIVGDYAEVGALNDVFGPLGLGRHSVALGSVKSQIGHLKAAAGAASLLKAVLSLHHKVLPPSAQFHEPNPDIRFEDGPFYVNTQARPWETPSWGVRRASVSAFGFGGTNFHVVLEEHVPGMLTSRRPQIQVPGSLNVPSSSGVSASSSSRPAPKLLRGMVLVAGSTLAELRSQLVQIIAKAERNELPPKELPTAESMRAPQRIAIDYDSAAELKTRAEKAIEAIDDDRPAAWRLLRTKGIFRGLDAPGKVAFLFPGQGSQYVNMLRELRDASPKVREVFDEADAVMRDRLNGRLLTDLIFVNDQDPKRLEAAENALRHTTVCQPAMLAADIALARLLADFGIEPDMVMGHSLGEYAALVASGVMPFADALVAVSARAREMANVSLADPGKMAGVIGPYDKLEAVLKTVSGYVVAANLNSHKQTVIAGATQAVEEASERLRDAGLRVIPLSVSHAFHSEIVAPASEPLRRVIRGLHIRPPQVPIVANVDGKEYPQRPASLEEIIDRLGRQIAAPVQFVRGLDTLYEKGVRVFVEVGPKRVLASFAEECLNERGDIVALATNNPKTGPEASFGSALAYLYSIGRGRAREEQSRAVEVSSAPVQSTSFTPAALPPAPPASPAPAAAPASASQLTGNRPMDTDTTLQLGRLFAEFLDRGMSLYRGTPTPATTAAPQSPVQTAVAAQGSVVVSGTGLGLPGTYHELFDEQNVERILRGDQMIEPISEPLRDKMVDKNVVRLIKSEHTSPTLDLISDTSQVIKLAGRRGPFDLVRDFDVAEERASAYDITTEMAVAAGLLALRDAGIPLVRRYRKTSKGTFLPDRWMLPEPLSDETGIIFASAFPGYNRFAELLAEYHDHKAAKARLQLLLEAKETLPPGVESPALNAMLQKERQGLDSRKYAFERKFLFEILAMGHSQFAELIGARGPNAQVNAACSSTTLAVSMAEDWIRTGRCTRVLVIASDDATSDTMLEWIGAGFLASGAATTEEDVTRAALPFDRRRHGMILGMGACALVVESEDAIRQRGMRGITELLGTETANSAFHGTRLDVQHICSVMEKVVRKVEQRHQLSRRQMAPQMVFVSHETYTPARGGSASAEVHALRTVFGDAASQIVIANTKGFTGHPMGVGLEDALTVKILERQIVPPIPNFREVDPELGELNLSKGGSYPVQYALRFSAGFGSQIAITVHRRLCGQHERMVDGVQYARWLRQMSGYPNAHTEVAYRTLRIHDDGLPTEATVATPWKPGDTPTLHAQPVGGAAPVMQAPVPVMPTQPAVAPASQPAPAPAAPQAPLTDTLAERVLRIVAEKTGYPTDMLAMDLDLEADLGIDTVKQAEVFAEIRKVFELPKRDDLKLRNYPTLAHVIQYVRDGRGESAPVAPAPAPAAAPAPVAAPAPTGADPVQAKVLEIVAEKTGYPIDMLALDLDLEADLGIDTVKQAEVLAEIRKAFDMPRRDTLKLRDYPTLGHVIGYVHAECPHLAPKAQPSAAPQVSAPVSPSVAAAQPASTPQPAASGSAPMDEITQAVLDIVADKTGYPTDMLAMDLDLEADLGVDTVKQAEVFAQVRERFQIPRINDLKLRDYPTLGHVVQFVRSHRVEESPAPRATSTEAASTAQAQDAGDSTIRRLVPTPMVRPSLALAKPTQCKLGPESRVLVIADRSGVAQELEKLLRNTQAQVLVIDGVPQEDEMAAKLKAWAGTAPIDGMFFLPAIDGEQSFDDLDFAAFRSLLNRTVRSLYAVTRVLYDSLERPGTFVLSATRLGGLLGYGSAPAQSPWGGAVSGYTKALARERTESVIKVVDFERTEAPASMAQKLFDEVLRDSAALEVGYAKGLRYGITLVEDTSSTDPSDKGIRLGSDSVFVVTGAAGAITSAITVDLAKASQGTFYLLDLPPVPDASNPDLARIHTDREALKHELMTRLRQGSSDRVTPAMVERELQRIERESVALTAIRAVEQAGAKAHYISCNATDPAAVSPIIQKIAEQHGRIDVILNAAGLEKSRGLDTKDANEFNLIFDVKALGLFNLLAATRSVPLGAIVSFSSVAGRFGNAGQVDYSAANDLLCKTTSALRVLRPDTQAIVIDWTAWGGIGMATRGSIPELLKKQGVEMLNPVLGIPAVRQELQRGRRGEVVICGALGNMIAPHDVDGGISAQALPQNTSPVQLTVLRADPYEGVVFQTTLDPKEPFLNDHRIDDTPVLPGVMGVEIFAQAVCALLPEKFVSGLRNVRFEAPFKCYRNEKRTAEVTVRLLDTLDGLMAECVLSSSRVVAGLDKPAEVKRHFAATLLLSDAPSQGESREIPAAKDGAGSVDRESLYRAYFHTDSFRVLQQTQVGSDGKVLLGTLAQPMPTLFASEAAQALTGPRLLELCFQTAGVIEIGSTKQLGLPSRIDEMHIYQGADDNGPRTALVTVSSRDSGLVFDAAVCNEQGSVVMELRGYHTSALPSAMSDEVWQPLGAGLLGFDA